MGKISHLVTLLVILLADNSKGTGSNQTQLSLQENKHLSIV